MRNRTKLAIGLLFFVLAMGLALPQASAEFLHPRGLMMATYPNQILVFWSASTYHSAQLIVIIMPPFYFVEDLNHFDTVTLTASLKVDYMSGSGEMPELLDSVAQWTNVVIEQDGDGAIVGAYLLHTVTFVITPNTASGWYLLRLNAEATTGDVTFKGFDQIGVGVRPGRGPQYGRMCANCPPPIP